MPVVTINDDGGTAITNQYIDAIEHTASTDYSTKFYEYLGASGSRVVFVGDFTVDAGGNFVGGEATQIRVFNASGVKQATITHVAIDSADFVGLTSIYALIALYPDSVYRGGDGADYFYPSFSDDTLEGGDTIRGGGGNDTITGSFGNTYCYGEGGDDLFYVASTFDTTDARYDGGSGVDTLLVNGVDSGLNFDLAITGPQETGAGAVVRLRNIENLTGFDGGNTFGGNAKANLLDGGAGDDTLTGAGGADTLLGGDDDDSLSGGDGFDLLRGSNGQDTLNGDAGADTLDGGAGADVMRGGAGNDSYVVDDAGDKVIETAGGGADFVEASVSFSLKGTEVENLTLVGTAISGVGNALDNVLRGNAEDNVLNAGPGLDTLRGGGGRDTFVFNSPPAPDNVDVIQDFKPGVDTLSLGSNAFLGLSPGALPAGAFFVGTAAHDGNDRIIYNSATGALLFDVDGKGGEAAVRFATLEAGLALTADDFIVT